MKSARLVEVPLQIFTKSKPGFILVWSALTGSSPTIEELKE